MFDEDSIGGPERIAKRLLPRLRELDLRNKPTSDEAGLGDSYVRDITQRKGDGSPRVRDPGYTKLRKLGAVIGRSPAWIMGDRENLTPADIAADAKGTNADSSARSLTSVPHNISVEQMVEAITFGANVLGGCTETPDKLEIQLKTLMIFIRHEDTDEPEYERINRILGSVEQLLLNVVPNPPLETDPAFSRIQHVALHLLEILALAGSASPAPQASLKAV